MREPVALVLCALLMFGCGGNEPTPQNADTAATHAPPPPAPLATAAPVEKPAKHGRKKMTDFHFERGALKLPGPVVFEQGSDKLRPESDTVLQVVQDYLEAKPEVTHLRIEGHTDNDGNAAVNQTLSERRALSVARWLVGQGVECKRLVPVGFGPNKPVAGTVENQTNEEKELNRRVSFVNAALHDKPIGGMPTDGGGKSAGDPCK
jgi:OOP family OmpA-OmpF porin